MNKPFLYVMLSAALTVAAIASAPAAADESQAGPASTTEGAGPDWIARQMLAQYTRPTLPGTTTLKPLSKKRAMVIVVEENDKATYSVTWSGLGRSMTNFDYKQLMPSGIRSVVAPVVDASVNVARTLGLPAAGLADWISNSLGRQAARMMGEYSATMAAQAGLPAGGCARQMFDTLATKGIRSGENPFNAFKNVYGETAMSNCLKAMAEPYYDTVVVLTDSGARFDAFSDQLVSLHKNNYVIDVLINLHGCGTKSGTASALNNLSCGTQRLVFAGGDTASPQNIAGIKARNGGQPLNLNAVYQVSCWGSEFNTAWTSLGAKAVNGARELNYYVLLSPFVFMDRFTRGNRSLKDASQDAYLAERSLLGGQSFTAKLDLRPFLNSTFPPPGFGIDLIAAACPGGTRDGCNWAFTPPFNSAMNLTLSRVQYGYVKTKPVNHSASSARVHTGGIDIRRALAATHDGAAAVRVASSQGGPR